MNRIRDIQQRLDSRGIDAMLLLSAVNRRYAAGFPSSDGALLVTRGDAWFFTDSRYIEAARAALTGVAEVGLTEMAKTRKDWLCERLAASGVQKLGIEEARLSHAEFLRLEQALTVALIPAEALITELRAAKSPAEKERLIAAQRLAEAAFLEVLALLAPGLTERQIAAELVYRMLRHGAEGLAFEPIVVGGPRGSMPHGVPGDRPVQRGEFVTMDFGCVLDGWCSDTTRTVALGAASEEMQLVYGTVLRAQGTGIAAARAGVPGSEIDAAGRRIIEDAGFGEYFGHSFGHSLGMECHEGPNAAPRETRIMPAGAVISAEPGIYLPGRFGVRIEDVLYLTPTGAENITRLSKDLLIL